MTAFKRCICPKCDEYLACVICGEDITSAMFVPVADVERLRKAAEWSYMRALRIAEAAYRENGARLAARAIANRLADALSYGKHS